MRRARAIEMDARGEKETTPARREKSAEVRQERTREEIKGDCEGERKRERVRESLLLGLRLPRSR